MNGAEHFARALELLGVEVVFGLPGVHNRAIWAALADTRIRIVGVRHEQAAGYAADGYYRATGRLGVAVVTTGPGAANTLAAFGEAATAGSSVLVVATDTSTRLRRRGMVRGVLHEVDGQATMFSPLAKPRLRSVPLLRLSRQPSAPATSPSLLRPGRSTSEFRPTC